MEIYSEMQSATLRRCAKPYATVNLHKRLFPGRSFSLGPKQILTGTSSASPRATCHPQMARG